MTTDCPNCGSKNTNEYRDRLVCFDCKEHQVYIKLTSSKKPEANTKPSLNSNWKLSGNNENKKRFFVGANRGL